MKAGVLFPLSSFPSDFGIGDFGKNAYQTIDLLKQNGIFPLIELVDVNKTA